MLSTLKMNTAIIPNLLKLYINLLDFSKSSSEDIYFAEYRFCLVIYIDYLSEICENIEETWVLGYI